MTRKQTNIQKHYSTKMTQKYLNSSCDKESDGTLFCRLELPQPSYRSIKILQVFLWNAFFALNSIMAFY